MRNKEVSKTENNVGKKAAKQSSKLKKATFPLLTLLLLVFLIQTSWGVIVNTAKVYSLRTKISALEKINKSAKRKNTYLREELEKYNSNSGVEALARDRLQFSKEDETLVIIKNIQQEKEE